MLYYPVTRQCCRACDSHELQEELMGLPSRLTIIIVMLHAENTSIHVRIRKRRMGDAHIVEGPVQSQEIGLQGFFSYL